jgi:hypothetical protein
VTYVSSDFREAHVELPLSWRTRNRVGTIFGGSLYGAVDPVYMILLMQILGPGYTVWDKAASIRFRKPGKTTLFARFLLTEEEIATIRSLAPKPARSTASTPSTSPMPPASSTPRSKKPSTSARTPPELAPHFTKTQSGGTSRPGATLGRRRRRRRS